MSPRRRPLLAGLAGLLVVVVAAPSAVLLAVDGGAADGLVRGALQAKLKRSVRFSHLHARLLARDPVIVLDDLAIGSPPDITREDLLRARSLTAHLRLGALLTGRIEPISIALAEADLRLVRLGRGRNNYSFGKGGSGGLLASVKSLSAPGGRMRMDDPDRKGFLAGRFALDGRPGVALPLSLDATGSLSGGAVELRLAGGPLNGVPPDAPWPLDATMVDGQARMHLRGRLQKAFDFRGFDLQVEAQGPNLADLGYLVNTATPNSRPFTLRTHATRVGRKVRMSGLVARLGASDFAGEVVSDHDGPRGRMEVRLASRTLHAGDVAALLAAVPPHAVTRVTPGGDGGGGAGGGDGLLSSRPLPLAALRSRDGALSLKADRVEGLPVALRALNVAGRLERGRLTLSPLRAELAPGRVTVRAGVDATSSPPVVSLTAHLEGARLGALKPGLAHTADGRLDAAVDLQGAGASIRAAALRAQGRASLRLSAGRIDRLKGSVVSGDLLGAVGAALGSKKGDLPLTCAVVEARAAGGALTAERLTIVTGAGVAHGVGAVDLSHATLDLKLVGRPTGRALLHADAPITVGGPLAHPKIGVDRGRAIAQGGAAAALAVVATPLAAVVPFLGGKAAPAPDCAALLAHAAAFVR